jgi:hypothetical protein
LEYAEQHLIATRTQKAGENNLEYTGKMLASIHQHDVSRRGDFDLHTHALVFNSTIDSNDKLKTIENFPLVTNTELLDRIYMNELAGNLQEKGLETEIKDQEKGNWELKGIDPWLNDKYSKGKKEVDQRLKDKGLTRGNSSSKERDIANKETRENKKVFDLEKKREELSVDCKARGQADLPRDFKPSVTAEDKQKLLDRALTKLESHQVAFTKHEFICEAMRQGLNGQLKKTDAEKYFSDRGRFVEMGQRKGNNYYSTENSIKYEQSIYDQTLAGKGQWQGIDKATVEKHIANHNANTDRPLNQGQQDCIKQICSTHDRVSCIIGDAGTGKTFSLSQAKNILNFQGFKIEAVALSNTAVGELRGAGFEKASTIHNLLNRMEKEAGNKTAVEKGQIQKDWNFNGLKPSSNGGNEIWIIDEASFVDNKTMSKLQEAAELRGAQVVMMGDSKQLQPVGSGKPFSNLAQDGRLETARLSENIRQKNAPENIRDAVNAAAQGKIRETLEKLDKNMVEIGKREDRLSTIAKDYAKFTDKERPDSIITSTNKDRIEINNKIRDELKANGELANGKEFKTDFGPREFAVGDKIAFLKTDKLNGQKIAKNDSGNIVGIKGDVIKAYHNKSKSVFSLSMKSYPAIDHGYAKTTYKSQGESKNKVWINQDTKNGRMNNRNDLYVKISRTKDELKIYTDKKPKLEDVTCSKMYKQVIKEQYKSSIRDFKDRPTAFFELPIKAQNEIIKGDRNLARADQHRQKAEALRVRAETSRIEASNIRQEPAKEREAAKMGKKAERLYKQAARAEKKAQKFEHKSEKNYSKAVELNDKSNQKHGTNRDLMITAGRPGVIIGGREDSRSKAEPARGDPGQVADRQGQEQEKDQLGKQSEDHQAKTQFTDKQSQIEKGEDRTLLNQEQVTEQPDDRADLQPDQKDQKGSEKLETQKEVEQKQDQELTVNIESNRKAEKDISNRDKSIEFMGQGVKEFSTKIDPQQEIKLSSQVEKDPFKIFEQFDKNPENHEQNQESKEFQNISQEDLEYFNREQQLEPIRDEEYNQNKELEPIPDREQFIQEIDSLESKQIEPQQPERSEPGIER